MTPRPVLVRAGAAFAATLLATIPGIPCASAQALLPLDGFAALPSFAWPDLPERTAPPVWEGGYARASTGFQVTSSRRFGTVAGPTLGFEGGKLWRDGDIVYGIVGGLDAMAPLGRVTPRFNGMTYMRDFAGALQVKLGTLVTDDLLVYGKVGLSAVHDTLRFAPSLFGPSFSREDIAVRPDARIGAEWRVTDRLTVGIEVGTAARPIR